MKKYKFLNIKTTGIYLCILILFASCKKQLDINVDPNNPPKVPVTALLPSAQVNLAYSIGGDASRYGGSFIQYYAGHRAQPLEYAQYDFTPSTSDTFWSNMFAGVLQDLKEVELVAGQDGNTAYVGISNILTAYSYSILTDMYGDIPFSEALGGIEKINPKYEKQEDIYPKLFVLIDKGIAEIKKNGGSIKPGADDLIFNGDLVKWEKFANALKLRLYNHLSQVQPNAAANFLNTNPLLPVGNADNAVVIFGNTPATANPVHQFDELSGRKDNAIAKTLIDKMVSLSDPRIPIFFFPVKNDGAGLQGKYLGNEAGIDNDDAGENNFSRTGAFYASINSPVVLLSSSEVNFIKAEIQQKAGNLVASKLSYDSAISNDFEFLGLTVVNATTYLSQPQITFDNSLSRIMNQKWITMFQAPYEGWVDWRRTGFPVLVPAKENRTNGIIPLRIPYPQLEINLNRASLEAGPGVPVPYDAMKIPLWWDK